MIRFLFTLTLLIGAAGILQAADPEYKLDNPMSVAYLQQKLRKSQPRLVLNSDIETALKQKVKTDPVLKNVYQAIRLNADEILKIPIIEREVIGRRMLGTSREMLYRVNMLGMVYRMEKDKAILDRLNQEVLSVCNFVDWHPSHYLDVAEMALAVALAVDWAADGLPASTVELAKTNLIEKGIKPSYNKKGNTGWVTGTNNWNQVCHGGMIAAAIVTAEKDPQLASETIHRALEGMPHALEEYGPDGVYPEGSTYWGYGTSFTVVTAAMFESAFGTDFGLAQYPGLQQSAVFRALSNAPSGWYYNFADCGDKRGSNGDMALAWFATQSGNPELFERERFLRPASEMGKLGRLDGAGLVYLSQFKPGKSTKLPTAWYGGGSNPVVIFTGGPNDSNGYYFGGKGGRGTVNHGNMDGGSFIFELNGVRWSVDPGNQEYNALEQAGFKLWGKCQDCERWNLLTKNNYGHSTLTVNGKLHTVDGLATITDFKDGDQPEATVQLSAAFLEQIGSARRRFVKENGTSLLIEDHLVLSNDTKTVTWQMMTTADVEVVKGGAILHQDGKKLKLDHFSHPDLTVSVVSLYPAPLQLDRQIPGLKRIEITLPAYWLQEKETVLRVRLSGM